MAYIGPSIETGFRQRYVYTATAGQTSFSGGDSVGITLTYTDSEYLDVYQNGVLLVPGSDYAATTGTTVVLVTGASLNDKVEMIAYQAFGVADTVSRADGGAFGGAVSMASTLTVADDANFDSGTLFVDASTNRVGVGTTSPNNPLEIAHTGSVGAGGLRIGDPDTIASDTGIYLRTTGDAVIGAAGGDIVFDSNMAVQEDMRITSAGEVTKPRQPAFQANPASVQTNIAVGSNVDIVFGTEVFDIGSNFASSTFTAPVSGKYFLSASIRTEAVDSASNYYLITIVTSNRGYQFIFDPDFGQDAGFWVMSLSHIADMDASDTAKVQIVQQSGTQQTDITTESTFSGILIG